jgi:hypothetical protein
MQTLYLFVMAALGGFLALFGAAGWSSYKEKKLPATPMLFRWFVTGLLAAGLGGYAWMFGAGGDPSTLLDKVGDALEVKEVVATLTSAVGGAVEEAGKKVSDAAAAADMKVGMPTF